jgi:mycothiol system anti-sigma-R factor
VSCDQSQLQVHAYFDGELDAPSAAAFETHLKSCTECRSALASEEALRESITQANLYERAPAQLRQSIAAQLPKPVTAISPRNVNPAWRWLAVAASILFLTSLGWQLLPQFRTTNSQSALVAAAVDAHLRSLQQGHLADVQSTDQHTVKPWFDGKLDFAPPVRDLASNDFPLLGGRIDILEGKTVAALVYGRRKHIINVFIEPTNSPAQAEQSGTSQGYNWLTWQNAGFHFSAVSDVNLADLQQLKQLLTTP